MLLVGGGLTGWLSWRPHQEKLATTRRVARAQPLIVQLGLDNEPVPADYSVGTESAALAAAADDFASGLQGEALKVKGSERSRNNKDLHAAGPLDLVAWSYGALISLDFALDHPERVRTLALIEPPAFWVLEAVADPLYEKEREAVWPLAEKIRDGLSQSDLVEFVRYASLCPPDIDPTTLPQWPVWLEHRQSLRRQFDAEFDHRDTVERLRAFPRPVLLVKGKGSTPALLRIVDVLAKTIPRARVVEFEGGHAPHIVEMDAFLSELARFHAAAL